jgi:hypothetical protein
MDRTGSPGRVDIGDCAFATMATGNMAAVVQFLCDKEHGESHRVLPLSHSSNEFRISRSLRMTSLIIFGTL